VISLPSSAFVVAVAFLAAVASVERDSMYALTVVAVMTAVAVVKMARNYLSKMFIKSTPGLTNPARPQFKKRVRFFHIDPSIPIEKALER